MPLPQGSFYAFANISGARAGRDIWDLVHEWLGIGVAVLPGTAFGADYGDWARLSLATRREDIVDAARTLRDHVRAAVPARG